MTAINQSVLDASNTSYVSAFQEIFQKADPGPASLFTRTLPADGKDVELLLAAFLGKFREWIGAKTFDVSRAYRQQIKFKKFHKSMKIERPDLAYDKAGVIRALFEQFMAEAKGGVDQIVTESLVGNPIGYDGVALASAAHPHGPSGNQSNTTTSALSFSTYETAKVAMASWLKENGEPFRVSPTHLMVGPKMEKVAKEITQSNERYVGLSSATAEGGTTVAATSIPNVFGGGEVTLVVNSRLVGTYDDYWYLMDLSGPWKPMNLIQQRAIEPVFLDRIDDVNRFMNDELLYSLEGDLSPAAGAWQTIYAGIVA